MQCMLQQFHLSSLSDGLLKYDRDDITIEMNDTIFNGTQRFCVILIFSISYIFGMRLTDWDFCSAKKPETTRSSRRFVFKDYFVLV